MSEWSKVTAATAAEIRRKYQPEKAAGWRWPARDSRRARFSKRSSPRTNAPSATLSAHALPVRETIWWAVRAISTVADPADPEAQGAALKAAWNWVAEPTEASPRRVGRCRTGRV